MSPILKPTLLAILREHSPVDVLLAMAEILGEQSRHIQAAGAAAKVVSGCAYALEGRSWPTRSVLCEPLREYNE